MQQLLSIVEDLFQISGRGLIVVPGIPSSGNWKIKIGDPLVLKRPDGIELTTIVSGIEMLAHTRPGPHPMPILLGAEVTKEDVPIGTELWVEVAD
jgi:translation elongation factor EF-Tu-like GTPase